MKPNPGEMLGPTIGRKKTTDDLWELLGVLEDLSDVLGRHARVVDTRGVEGPDAESVGDANKV